jgi:hypothetical protein
VRVLPGLLIQLVVHALPVRLPKRCQNQIVLYITYQSPASLPPFTKNCTSIEQNQVTGL